MMSLIMPMITMPGMPEMLVIFVIVLLLFGAKKIPELMRGIGKGVKNFKEGINSIEEDVNSAPEGKRKEIDKKEAKSDEEKE